MLTTAVLCLALNVYHEARGEPVEGQYAVAQVTMNRAGHEPAKICDVVFEPYQFSWTTGLLFGRPSRQDVAPLYMPTEVHAWQLAKQVATDAIAGRIIDVVGDATHYHTISVRPRWSQRLTKVAQVGAHLFYRTSAAVLHP